jgi:anthranilate phosphoribosyltransferase
MKDLLAKAINGNDLTPEEAERAIGALMSGEVSPAMTAAFLVALRMKGETVAEITGAARAMRAHSVKVPVHHNGRPLFDTAGTGGDGAHTFNLSTAAAFVIAGTGRKVAKHGNRAASSRSGSADVLAALGVSLDLTPERVGQAIDEVGIGFMFAPRFHPAMKHVGPVRQELGQRTIFNLLGPLTNPAGADVQIIGVYATALTDPLAHVLGQLGTQAAMVVHGYGGTDELNLSGPAQVSHLQDGHVRTYTLDPVEFGFTPAPIESLKGGTPEENAALMRAVLDGSASLALREAVLFNAAAAIAAETDDLAPAIAEARASLESGAAKGKLEALVNFSHG